MPNAGKFTAAISTGELAAGSHAVYTGICYLAGLQVLIDGTNDGEIVVYDNTAASGKVIGRHKIEGTALAHYGGRNFSFPVVAQTGLYAVITGTNAKGIVEYIAK